MSYVKPPYYLSAYSLAVKAGFKGSLEEWLESLNGRGVELRYFDHQVQWRRAALEGEPEDEWKELFLTDEIRDEVEAAVLADALRYSTDAQQAAKDAAASVELANDIASSAQGYCSYVYNDCLDIKESAEQAAAAAKASFDATHDHRALAEVEAENARQEATKAEGFAEQAAMSAEAATQAVAAIPGTLPNPQKLILTGAVEAEYDGSGVVKVEIPVGGGGADVHIGSDEPQNGETFWINPDEEAEAGAVSPEAIKQAVDEYMAENPVEVGDCIAPPATASVGQTIVVKAVDETGKPTEWEAADLPSGGGEWKLLATGKLTKAVSTIEVDKGLDGRPFSVSKMRIELLTETEPEATGQCNTFIQIYSSSSTDAYQVVNGLFAGTSIGTWMELSHSPNQMLPMWFGESFGTPSRITRYMDATHRTAIRKVIFGTRGSLNYGAGTEYRLFYK